MAMKQLSLAIFTVSHLGLAKITKSDASCQYLNKDVHKRVRGLQQQLETVMPK